MKRLSSFPQLGAARPSGAHTFAILYTLESLATASTTSVIPIQAYDLLKSKQAVSLLYTLVAIFGLVSILCVPLALGRLPRRGTYTVGVLAILVSTACLATGTLPGQMLGMVARVVGLGTLSTTLNLYVMANVRRNGFVHAESLRLAWSTVAWICGPTLGVFLYTRFGLAAAYGTSAVFAVILLATFWSFRLSDGEAFTKGPRRPANPLTSIRRYAFQPRLRLAWVIAVCRSCFWKTFFVYAPILMIATGQGKLAGGLLVSAGNSTLAGALLWNGLNKKVGTRRLMALAFSIEGLMLLVSGYTGEQAPLMTGGLLLVAAFFCVATDSLAASVFMRAVHPYERAQMSSVYRTFPFVADLAAPLAYSIILLFFNLGGVFATLGVIMLCCGALTWCYLPVRL